ncbi:MAG: WYL domain-containing protein, partial [Clostridia bacterium]|nr:WYL domain-containing protein [Clostridia bacterium]
VSRDQVSERYLDPYHVRYHQGAWYLIAYCHTRAEVRIFALDRIRELKVMEERFEPVNDFSLEEYLGLSMGIERGYGVWEVAIKFTPFQARWIRERKWHASQEMEELDDGSLILKLKVAGLNEVKRWVLSFGKEAEVLAPPELREEIAAELAAMVALY